MGGLRPSRFSRPNLRWPSQREDDALSHSALGHDPMRRKPVNLSAVCASAPATACDEGSRSISSIRFISCESGGPGDGEGGVDGASTFAPTPDGGLDVGW